MGKPTKEDDGYGDEDHKNMVITQEWHDPWSEMSAASSVEGKSLGARHTPKAHDKSHVRHLDGPTASPPASIPINLGAPVLQKGQCLYVHSVLSVECL